LSHFNSDITFNGRFRIILFAGLSLFFALSPILPDSIKSHSCQFSGSFHSENDNFLEGKTIPGIEAAIKSKRSFQKQLFQSSSSNTFVSNAGEKRFLKPGWWIRPAYYVFLYIFNLF
jgi:hypothetical protein